MNNYFSKYLDANLKVGDFIIRKIINDYNDEGNYRLCIYVITCVEMKGKKVSCYHVTDACNHAKGKLFIDHVYPGSTFLKESEQINDF